MATEKKRKSWRDLGAEMIGIIFAVLLALWLEGWREDIERQDRADDFLVRIQVEVNENRDSLKSAITANQRNIDGLTNALKAEKVEFEVLANFLEFDAGATRSAAWNSAQMTRSISEMPVETTTTLAALYDTQAYFADYVRVFLRQYTDLTVAMQHGSDPRTAAQKFVMHMAIVNSLATQAVSVYDTFLGPEAATEAEDEPLTDAEKVQEPAS